MVTKRQLKNIKKKLQPVGEIDWNNVNGVIWADNETGGATENADGTGKYYTAEELDGMELITFEWRGCD